MPMILRSTCLIVLQSAVMLSLVGCQTDDAIQAEKSGGSYRTIVAEPLRDLEGAREANAKGLAHLDGGDLMAAEQAFKQAIEADPTFGPAHNHLGKVYFLRRRFYLAAHEFDKASQQMPNRAEPRNNLALTLIEAGKPSDAVEYLREAVSLDPYNIEYQANLANALILRGDQTSEVIVLLQAVVQQDERTAWRVWASQQLGKLGLEAD